eukprot:4743693-Lingulodinium_polyedra.AAC.1
MPMPAQIPGATEGSRKKRANAATTENRLNCGEAPARSLVTLPYSGAAVQTATTTWVCGNHGSDCHWWDSTDCRSKSR